MFKYYISLGSNRDLGWFGEFTHKESSILVLAVNCCIYKHYANCVSKLCSFVDILLSKYKKFAVLKLLDICFVKFKWKIVNIFARLWKSAQLCHWAIFPCSEANFSPEDRWNRKSQIIPKLGGILKFKPQQCYNLIKTLLQTENEGRLGFELWPRFARFFCAFALRGRSFIMPQTWGSLEACSSGRKFLNLEGLGNVICCVFCRTFSINKDEGNAVISCLFYPSISSVIG